MVDHKEDAAKAKQQQRADAYEAPTFRDVAKAAATVATAATAAGVGVTALGSAAAGAVKTAVLAVEFATSTRPAKPLADYNTRHYGTCGKS
ncbi:MAG TPA: hypothetical protein VD770_01230 [Coxiellaceae bacterium]|nr:hypothetical protein [Coxiellaceae bacterium]